MRSDDGLERVIPPESFDLKSSFPGSIDGGSGTENAHAIRAILEGKTHPTRGAIFLNAAADFAVCREIDDKKHPRSRRRSNTRDQQKRTSQTRNVAHEDPDRALGCMTSPQTNLLERILDSIRTEVTNVVAKPSDA